MTVMTSLQGLVDEWLRLDQNQSTRAEIQKLREDGNVEELEKRMRPRIEFGTAGLRGKMEAGWSRMNDLIIIQTSQGLCAYVMQQVRNAASRGVVIGYDHRHNSERWAQMTTAVFIANGVKVYLHRSLVHTPMIPFSVRKVDAACGVMITASHNPKQDNGYKVYWENAVQIIGPHDAGISNCIKAHLEPKKWADSEDVRSSPLCIDRTEELRAAYFDELSKFCICKSINTESPLTFVNTSMHGVSHPFVVRAFEIFGLRLKSVKEQESPDPEFPTVKFPNPEEQGALDLAMRTADMEGATYVLAQDPDGDRFSAAQKRQDTVYVINSFINGLFRLDGQWTIFTGDQLGALFASRAFELYKSSGRPLKNLAMVTSTVSSKMIEAMAQAEGFKSVECLTGFKFIGNAAVTLAEQGYEVPFGYEEAIGFMFGSEVRDKDGVAAAVSFAELVAFLYSEGQTAESHLQALYQRYGYFQVRL